MSEAIFINTDNLEAIKGIESDSENQITYTELILSASAALGVILALVGIICCLSIKIQRYQKEQ